MFTTPKVFIFGGDYMLSAEIINSPSFQLELILRMLIASSCGAVIGFERNRHQKEAGMRTHIFVALGACVFAICSKYAFTDMMGMKGINVDIGRIASNLVTGCCFLGAGVIFVRNKAVTGLTTAAGVWVVAGIGLCFGTGMYFVGAGVLLIDIIVQYGLHGVFSKVEGVSTRHIVFVINNKDEVLESFVEDLKKIDSHLTIVGVSHKETNYDTVTLSLRMSANAKNIDIIDFMKRYPYVLSAEL